MHIGNNKLSSGDRHARLLEELIAVERELSALEALHAANPMALYRPNKNQEPFHISPASGRVCTGSNRSGKSEGEVLEALAHVYGERYWLPESHPMRKVHLGNGQPIPVPNVGRMFGEEFKVFDEILVPKIRRWAPPNSFTVKKGYRGYPEKLTFKNGSEVFLRVYQQDSEAQEGHAGHWASFDEPPPYDVFIAVRRGLMDAFGNWWMALTPLSEPWIWDILLPQSGPGKRIEHFSYSIFNNMPPSGPMTQEAIDDFIADLDPTEYEARILGQPKYLVGRVFTEWRPEPPYYVEPYRLNPYWPRYCLVDPHPRKPVAVLWLAYDPATDTVVAYDELWDKRLTTIQDVSDAIKDKEAQHRGRYEAPHQGLIRIRDRIIDDSAEEQERGTGKTIVQLFAHEGLRFTKAYKRNKWAGYQAIHSALKVSKITQRPQLQIFTTCPQTCSNFLKHVWDNWKNSQGAYKDAKQDVVAKDDDFLACIRYFYQRNAQLAAPETLVRPQYEVTRNSYNTPTGLWTGV